MTAEGAKQVARYVRQRGIFANRVARLRQQLRPHGALARAEVTASNRRVIVQQRLDAADAELQSVVQQVDAILQTGEATADIDPQIASEVADIVALYERRRSSQPWLRGKSTADAAQCAAEWRSATKSLDALVAAASVEVRARAEIHVAVQQLADGSSAKFSKRDFNLSMKRGLAANEHSTDSGPAKRSGAQADSRPKRGH